MEVISPAAHPLSGSPAAFYFPSGPAASPKALLDSNSSANGDGYLSGPACAVGEPRTEGSRLYRLPPTARQNKVLPQDLKTPDNHVERDPRLIRLTGVHPFNVEAPLSDLYDEGFLTTKDLHYVRNHGPVPLVRDDQVLDWEFSVEGMVERPVEMTLRQLIRDYEQVTYPITLVCAGNRRKEQNVVRKTNGFSWGAAGVSTSLWTGVTLGDLLARAVPRRGARYVCFEGADKLPNGYYGTSVKLNWAVDPNRGIMVAHKMNGEVLHPDHGKPLRIVIPGQIGGRSVKWLKRIVVTSAPSDNWYHIYDNRVLPTMISPEASAHLPDTWKDERYAIYDLNTNSATCYPAHDERVSLAGSLETYAFRGYAYAGGGKRVTRVEVTLDQGRTWTLANITYPEDEYRLAPENEVLFGGRLDIAWREACFCWCFWDLEIPLTRLREARDVMVRAMDDSMMVQPRDMYWSVLGMMNNPWYRVVIHNTAGSLRFEHPTQPAMMPGGWMERVKREGGNITNGFWGEKVPGEEAATIDEPPAKEICMLNEKVTRQISLEELRSHDGEESPWFVLNGQVYDGTGFLSKHPGGAASIFGAAGQDVTEEFMTIHSENAKGMMPKHHIGTLDKQSLALLALAGSEPVPANSEPRPVFLQSKAWTKATLSAKKKISSDTKIFTFTLDHDSQTIGLPVGQHLMMRLRDPASQEAIIRAYTPISETTDVGKLHVLVKIYFDTPAGKGGRMTQALDGLAMGQPVEFKGPIGKFEYLGRGLCAINGRERRVRRFVMVCAGSGITPILQVLRAVMKDDADRTTCVVLDGNRVEEDILCRDELDAIAARRPDRCMLLYTLSRPDASWRGLKGRMDRTLFEREVGGPPRSGEGDAMVLVCGPDSMVKAVNQIFAGLGWRDEDLIFF
ncbi:nitrate reductase [Lasiosphaeria ovina]|uniref:Nitrate reductase n=1 Tax=Lasiosphaeria ovina TaxID=92902 RepID=A0AAE0N3L4_9PEZI|nr:nitrate reductase [Lasiosphaeria ovina]